MIISFICGSLEPGRDGVGDYCYRLATELTRAGHQASIIALNDPFISRLVQNNQVVDETSIKILRLPANLPSKQKNKIAKQFIDVTRPHWISLQFVPYSF